MAHYLESFRRLRDGSWKCERAVTIEHPRGRIQVASGSVFVPGTKFMDIDLAEWLDEQAGHGGLSRLDGEPLAK